MLPLLACNLWTQHSDGITSQTSRRLAEQGRQLQGGPGGQWGSILANGSPVSMRFPGVFRGGRGLWRGGEPGDMGWAVPGRQGEVSVAPTRCQRYQAVGCPGRTQPPCGRDGKSCRPWASGPAVAVLAQIAGYVNIWRTLVYRPGRHLPRARLIMGISLALGRLAIQRQPQTAHAEPACNR